MIVGCGQVRETDQTCTGENCSEQDINASVGDQNKKPSSPRPGIPNIADLRFPDFNASWQLPRSMFEKAQRIFEDNKYILANPRYVTIIDMGQHSGKKRFYLFDLVEQTVERHLTAHGVNS